MQSSSFGWRANPQKRLISERTLRCCTRLATYLLWDKPNARYLWTQSAVFSYSGSSNYRRRVSTDSRLSELLSSTHGARNCGPFTPNIPRVCACRSWCPLPCAFHGPIYSADPSTHSARNGTRWGKAAVVEDITKHLGSSSLVKGTKICRLNVFYLWFFCRRLLILDQSTHFWKTGSTEAANSRMDYGHLSFIRTECRRKRGRW